MRFIWTLLYASVWCRTAGTSDIEAILKALIAYCKGNGPNTIEVNAVSEMRNLSLKILDIEYRLAMKDRRHSRIRLFENFGGWYS
jgi:hypothetical protein